jgi:cell division protein FtsI (penicillin-binding protein 3)
MIRELLRRNVTQSGGGGRRADVAGYEVGGKTGTAEIAANGAYQERAVIASFLAAFPMGAPRYVLLVTIHEPRPSEETRGQITAGQTAAPVAARIIARTAPLLGLASH